VVKGGKSFDSETSVKLFVVGLIGVALVNVVEKIERTLLQDTRPCDSIRIGVLPDLIKQA
jgi:hypothetical protein